MSENSLIETPNGVSEIPAMHDEKANKIIRNYTIAATGSGLVPIPLISAAASTGIQVLMIRDLCRLFEVPFTSKQINVIVNSALGTIATRIVALATTVIPGISAPTKGLSGAAIAGLYVATVGEFYKVHFQDGGTLEDASINDLRKYFIEEYKRGDINTSSLNPVSMVKRIFG
jgi:uncharacterized protein (DUF697 family)